MEQFQYNSCSSDLCMDGLMKRETGEARGSWSGDPGANAVFSIRIRAKIVCDRISSAQIFGVKTNVLCALKKLYSLVQSQVEPQHLSV